MNYKEVYLKNKTKINIAAVSVLFICLFIYFKKQGKKTKDRLDKENEDNKNKAIASQKQVLEQLEKEKAEKDRLARELKETLEVNKESPTAKYAYSKGTETKVRNTTEVNDGWIHNRIGVVKPNAKIGLITNTAKGYDQLTWYKIDFSSLPKDIKDYVIMMKWPNKPNESAYVRSDVVNVKAS